MTSDATARRHDVLRAAMTLDDQLDDIKRAQIWSQIEDKLAAPAPARRSWRIPLAALAAAAALALLWLQLRPSHPAGRTLSAPAETTLATTLGPHARAELVGPASLELLGPTGDATAVHLTRGTLLAEFTGGPGRSLRIETREAVVEIVGTLFSVEAREGATCVSVAHGKVRVTTRTATLAVAGGESWCSTAPAVTPLDPTAHDHLDRFEAVITARAAPPAVVAAAEPPVTTSPTVVAATAPPVPQAAATSHRDEGISPHGPSAPPSSTSRTDPGSNAGTNESRQEVAAPAGSRPSTAPSTSLPAASISPLAPSTSPPAAVPAAAASPVATAPPTTPALTTEWPAPAPAPASEPPKPAAAPAVATPESLYEAAEAALARRDTAGADRILARLLADFPHASLADQALLERARIAYDRHAWRDAQHDLDQLAAIASTPLAEPGAYLACRIALAAHDGAAEHCLTEFRNAYPKSAHDLDVLGVLTDLAFQAGGCARARPRIDELVRAYSHTTLTHAWVARCSEGP